MTLTFIAIVSRRASSVLFAAISCEYLAESASAAAMFVSSSFFSARLPKNMKPTSAGPRIQAATMNAIMRSNSGSLNFGIEPIDSCGILLFAAFRLAPGFRLTLIMVYLCRPESESDGQHQHGRNFVDCCRLHDVWTDANAFERGSHFGADTQAIAQCLHHSRNGCAATREEHATDAFTARLGDDECCGALDTDRQLVDTLIQQRANVVSGPTALQEVFRVIGSKTALTLQCLAQTTRTERNISHQDRCAILQQVHVGGIVTNVYESNQTGNGFRIVVLERVVNREGIHIDYSRLDTGVREQAHAVLDQLALGGDQQNLHLRPFAFRIQNLEVEVHVLHVEWHVLLGLPTNHFTSIVLAHAIHRNRFDNDVVTANRGDDIRLLNTSAVDDSSYGFRNQYRIHHFTFNDGIRYERTRSHLHDLRLGFAVIHHNQLDESRTDVEAGRHACASEKTHFGGPTSFVRGRP